MDLDTTIVLNARDTFSSVAPNITTLLQHTEQDLPILAVVGGAPARLQEQWTKQFGDRIEWHFVDHFINQAQSRNMLLRKVKTKYAVVCDMDTFVRPGWLMPLIECQRDTGAVLVSPLILERPRRIHCAGCDLYTTTENGKEWGHKVLRYHRFPYAESANFKRATTDYGELHLMYIEVEPTLRTGAFDEKIPEVGEVDSALSWKKDGGSLWFEPQSVVHFVEDAPIRAEDIGFYIWRWDMNSVLAGYQWFEEKWGLDISEHGEFRNWLWQRNRRLGVLPRMFPSAASLKISNGLYRAAWKLRRLLTTPDGWWGAYRKSQLGFHDWPEFEESRRNRREQGHPALK